jgi:hypothetical protein
VVEECGRIWKGQSVAKPVDTGQLYESHENAELARAEANLSLSSRALAAAKSGGGKLSRSEVVTVRLDPKTRYLAELAARRQRRTLSSYIEWVIAENLDMFVDWEPSRSGVDAQLLAERFWDVDDCDRLVKLALYDNSLLNFREQVLWKRIQEQAAPGDLDLSERKAKWEKVRKIWAQLIAAEDTDATDDAPSPSKK